jgi:hypothetical protein
MLLFINLAIKLLQHLSCWYKNVLFQITHSSFCQSWARLARRRGFSATVSLGMGRTNWKKRSKSSSTTQFTGWFVYSDVERKSPRILWVCSLHSLLRERSNRRTNWKKRSKNSLTMQFTGMCIGMLKEKVQEFFDYAGFAEIYWQRSNRRTNWKKKSLAVGSATFVPPGSRRFFSFSVR